MPEDAPVISAVPLTDVIAHTPFQQPLVSARLRSTSPSSDVTARGNTLLHDQPDGGFEAGFPAGGKELLGIVADGRRTGYAQPDVETPVGTARDAVVATAANSA
jgi:hypothetical protein